MLADLVILNAHVYTMDVDCPRAEAVAIAGNRILVAGDDAEVRSLLRPGGKKVDAGGRAVLPGLIDAHVHFGWHSIAMHQRQVNLDNVSSKAAALALVASSAHDAPPGRWIQGGGWNQNVWPDPVFPTAADLDAISPLNPVALEDKSRHAIWVNSRALELSGITADTDDPLGGEILRDQAGRPTGVLLETACHIVHGAIPDPGVETMVDALRQGTTQAQSLGLTGVHDPGHTTLLAALQVLRARGEIGLRALVHLPGDSLEAALEIGLRSGLGDEYLRIGGVKLYADGALGPQSAHLLAPYEGTENDTGIPTLTDEELGALVLRAHEAGLAVTVHAIGDAANRALLDAIASAASKPMTHAPALPHRIEHVQLLHPNDLPRLVQLGVVASMQPIHATSDMEIAEQHWGRRSDLAYAWNSVRESGAHLAFGSDCPIEPLDPLLGIHAAVTRRRPDGSPGPDGWNPAQRLTVTQAVHAYTLGAAFASGESSLKGALSPGKLADLVILSQDIFQIEPMEILDARVEMTVFDGRIVYRHGL